MPGAGCCLEKALVEPAEQVVAQLRAKKLSVVTAESCTAGLIAAALSHGEGASDCLQGGFIVYTKESKACVLGISRNVLATEGSVSEPVARHLAEGALKRCPADLALSVTGVLGPGPDEDGKPAGLVYFGLAHRTQGRQPEGGRKDTPTVIEERFSAENPDAIRRAVVLRALALLLEATR